MAENNKNQYDLDTDYNFNAIAEFETSDKANPAGGADGSPDFGDFGGSSTDNDFTSGDFAPQEEPDFGDFGGTQGFDDQTGNVDFGADDFAPSDDFGGGSDFDFAAPPTPQSVEMDSLSGNPDEEFGDFGTGTGYVDDATAETFGDTDAPRSAAKVVDPFEDGDEDIQTALDEQPKQAASNDNDKPNFKKIAGIAAAVAVFGYVGYTHVPGMFSGGDYEVVQDVAKPSLETAQLPPGLPSFGTAPQQPPAGLPAPVSEPVATPVAQVPQAAAPTLDLGGSLPAPAVIAAVPATELPAPVLDQAPKPAKIDPLDEMVGGTDRGGLASMKDSKEDAAVAVAPSAGLAELSSRIDEVVKRLETIEQKVASFGASFEGSREIKTPTLSASTTPLPSVAAGGVSAPLKPPIIEDVVLRGVSRDIAWIATGTGVVEVKVGDAIDGAGTVESFQNYRGRWIAVTDKGIILPR